MISNTVIIGESVICFDLQDNYLSNIDLVTLGNIPNIRSIM